MASMQPVNFSHWLLWLLTFALTVEARTVFLLKSGMKKLNIKAILRTKMGAYVES